MAKQKNELLMKNHESNPSGSGLFLEVNAIMPNNLGHGRGCGHRRGRR